MSNSPVTFKTVAAWGGGVLGEQPFACYVFDSIQALQHIGLLEELPDRNVSPDLFSKLDYSKQTLLTFSWPDLNGQSVTVTAVEPMVAGILIKLQVATSQEPTPQFGMTSILVTALVVDQPSIKDSIRFEVNGQNMDFQIHRP